MKFIYSILVLLLILPIIGCEKEITVDLPPGRQSLVVEASINPLYANLNYVYLTRTLDYFNPDLSSNGVRNALVYITPGTVVGNDTVFDMNNRVQLFDIQTVPGLDTLLGGLNGIYLNPILQPEVGVPYLLEISAEGQEIRGITTIPKPVPIDTLYYRLEYDEADKDTDVFVTFEFTDPPEQNNYRLLGYVGPDALILGWGAANFSREFDDQLIGNGKRPYSFFSPFDYGDTLHLFLNNLGRKEYLFWESYDEAAGNGGPFATPIEVRSNVTGAIGSFTGYGTSYYSVILK
jgi:hypothetical protein